MLKSVYIYYVQKAGRWRVGANRYKAVMVNYKCFVVIRNIACDSSLWIQVVTNLKFCQFEKIQRVKRSVSVKEFRCVCLYASHAGNPFFLFCVCVWGVGGWTWIVCVQVTVSVYSTCWNKTLPLICEKASYVTHITENM